VRKEIIMDELKSAFGLVPEDIFGPIVPTCRWCDTPVAEGQEYCSDECRAWAERFRGYSVRPQGGER